MIKNYVRLGRIEWAILCILKDDSIERSTLFEEIRNQLYKDESYKCTTRYRIRSALRSLQKRNLIINKNGIVSLTD
jgi:hypothetical protein